MAGKDSRARVIVAVIVALLAGGAWMGVRYATAEVERRVKIALGSLSDRARMDYQSVRLGILPPRVRILGLTAQPIKLKGTIRAEEVVIRKFDRAHNPPHELVADARSVTVPDEVVEELRPDDAPELPWSKVITAVQGVDLGIRYTYDAAQQTLAVDEAYLDVPQAARVAFGVRLANLSGMPTSFFDKLDALGAVLLESFRLSTVEHGVIPRLLAERVVATGTPIPDVITKWVEDGSEAVAEELTQLDAGNAENVRAFLQAPGTLEIGIAPKVPFRLGGFVHAALTGDKPDLGPVTVRATPGDDLAKRVKEATAAVVARSFAAAQEEAKSGNRFASYELADRLRAADLASPDLDRAIAQMKEGFEKRASFTAIRRGEESRGCRLDAAGTLTCGTPAAPSPRPPSRTSPVPARGLDGLSSARVSLPSPDGRRFFVATYSSESPASGGSEEAYEDFEQLFLYDPARGLRPIESSYKYGPKRFLDWAPDGGYGIVVYSGEGDTWYDVVGGDSARVYTVRATAAANGCHTAVEDGLYGCSADRGFAGASYVGVDELASGWTRSRGDWAWRARAEASLCPPGNGDCELTGEGAAKKPALMVFEPGRRSLSLASTEKAATTAGSTRALGSKVLAACDNAYVALNGFIANELDAALNGGAGQCSAKTAAEVVACAVQTHASVTNPANPKQPVYVAAEQALAPCQVSLFAPTTNSVRFSQIPGSPTSALRTFSIRVD